MTDSFSSWHSLAIRIYIEDTDLTGVVYHANYLRYLERARSDWLCHHESAFYQAFLESGKCFVLQKLAIEYLKPAKLHDLITVHFTLDKQTPTRLFIRQIITLGEQVLSRADLVLASVEQKRLKPVAIGHSFEMPT